MSDRRVRERADAVATWAVGTGIGLIALMLTWIVGNRIATAVWDAPVGPTVALIGAIVVAVAATLIAGVRLGRSGRR